MLASAAMDLSYKEQTTKLQNRIRAHKEFANFDIESWIDTYLGRKPRRNILDVGCGSGNHFGVYLKHVGSDGRVVGVDREAALVETARKEHASADNVEFIVGSMDDPLPFPDASFDICLSNFAIYNASDVPSTLREIRRVLQPGGEVVLIGPTANNAREIYEYNQRLTGVAIDEITRIRTDRLRREILPIASEVFGKMSEEVLNSFLQFPNANEFLTYFKSTMAYEETAEKRGVTNEQMKAALDGNPLIISKEMLAIFGTKA